MVSLRSTVKLILRPVDILIKYEISVVWIRWIKERLIVTM